jgi:hypothetical protein
MAQPASWGYRNPGSGILTGESCTATCETLGDHDDQYQMICGTRVELEGITEEHDKLCSACL